MVFKVHAQHHCPRNAFRHPRLNSFNHARDFSAMLGVVSIRSMSAFGQAVASEVQFEASRGPRLAHLEPLGATFGLLPPLFGALSEPTRANFGAILGPSRSHFGATRCILASLRSSQDPGSPSIDP